LNFLVQNLWDVALFKNPNKKTITCLWGPEESGSLRFPDSVTSARESGRLSAIPIDCLYSLEYPGTYFERMSETWAHGLSEATKKLASDTKGDRCRELPTNSVVP
jgi:hypothetical protein